MTIPVTPTPTPTEAEIVAGGGKPVVVEQGPAWLAALLYAPPWWMYPTLLGLAGVWLGALALGRSEQSVWGEWGAVRAEAIENVCILACCGALTAAVAPVGWPYYVDVGIGVLCGYTGARWLIAPVVNAVVDELVSESRA